MRDEEIATWIGAIPLVLLIALAIFLGVKHGEAGKREDACYRLLEESRGRFKQCHENFMECSQHQPETR